MANQSKQSDVEQMFNRIARRYDLANDLQSLFLHRYWKKKVKSLAAVSSNQFALDICC
ncbi:MAG TPA: class I SAM-dependent methyltransferase, partial [Verrucomicrobiota bacterium]|nr:class I SAM-dependent methyltransferase [Verrucomicrobiota bacterium]